MLDRSPLQKLELELEHISNEEETAEVLYRRLTQRRHGRNASVISSRFEPPKRRTIVGVDGANDGPDIVSEEEENGIKATRFLTVPNPLRGHSLLGGDIHEHPVRIISPMVGQKQLRNQKVAHLTLEDLDLDHGVKISKEVPGEIAFLYEGESIGEAAAGSLDSPQDLLPKPEMLDGPTENPANAHSHRHQHDPEHPSSHHHPDHMQAPHTKEEREDALIMSYLRAIPGRKVPDRKAFTPPLSVRCGPLLRYCGMRRDIHESGQERETWRGSILIVTIDESSKYSPLPTARIFVVDSKNTGTSEVKDKKKGRSSRSKSRSGEGANKYREVEGLKLHTRRGHTFWRFNIEVELADAETKVAYRINKGPIITFWVPGNKQPMNIMFHSCNGFTLSVNPAEYNGPDPLWKDVLSKHQQRPFHVMLGGGDQGKHKLTQVALE